MKPMFTLFYEKSYKNFNYAKCLTVPPTCGTVRHDFSFSLNQYSLVTKVVSFINIVIILLSNAKFILIKENIRLNYEHKLKINLIEKNFNAQ